MFNWLKKILGIGPSVPAAIEAAIPAPEEKPQPKAKKSDTKVTKASLTKLTKQGLEDFAKETYGVDVDRRKKKDELVKEVLALSKKT
jgi:hypothetical protein